MFVDRFAYATAPMRSLFVVSGCRHKASHHRYYRSRKRNRRESIVAASQAAASHDQRRGSVASDLPTRRYNVENAALLELLFGAAQPENRLCRPPPKRRAEKRPVKLRQWPRPRRRPEEDNGTTSSPRRCRSMSSTAAKRIKANEAFLAALGLGGTGQKLPKKPSAQAQAQAQGAEEHESAEVEARRAGRRPSSGSPGRPAVVRLHRGEPAAAEARARIEPSPLTDEQLDRLGEFCMEGATTSSGRRPGTICVKSNFRRPTPSTRNLTHRLIFTTPTVSQKRSRRTTGRP